MNETLNTLYEKFEDSEFVLPDPTPYFKQLEDPGVTNETIVDATDNIFALGFNCKTSIPASSRSMQLIECQRGQPEFRHQAIGEELRRS